MGAEEKPEKIRSELNYYVLAAIFVGIIIFTIGNSIEPEDDDTLDFYEASILIGFAAATVFGFRVARRYWGSQIFGRTYLSLSIGFGAYFVGWALWFIYEIFFQVENPYPYYPDIGYFAFYPFAIYHLKTNIHYFKRQLNTRHKLILVILPLGAATVYAFFGYVPVEAESGLASLTILPTPEYDLDFYKEYFTGLAFVVATTLTFSYAIIGTQIFRRTVLGGAWGLLLVGIALNTGADIYYYIFELFGDYVRANPITGIWVAGTMIVCYALYKHGEDI